MAATSRTPLTWQTPDQGRCRFWAGARRSQDRPGAAGLSGSVPECACTCGCRGRLPCIIIARRNGTRVALAAAATGRRAPYQVRVVRTRGMRGALRFLSEQRRACRAVAFRSLVGASSSSLHEQPDQAPSPPTQGRCRYCATGALLAGRASWDYRPPNTGPTVGQYPRSTRQPRARRECVNRNGHHTGGNENDQRHNQRQAHQPAVEPDRPGHPTRGANPERPEPNTSHARRELYGSATHEAVGIERGYLRRRSAPYQGVDVK